MSAPRQFVPATVAEVRDAWMVAQQRRVAGGGLSASSLATYARGIDRFVDHVGSEKVLDDLDENDVDEALVAYAQSSDGRHTASPTGPAGKAAASVARYRTALTTFFAFAERGGYIRRNPMPDTVVKPSVTAPDASRTALPLATAQALLVAPDGPMAGRDTLILRFLLETGARNAELCAADGSDLTVIDNVPWLHIRRGKGGKQRDVPLTPSTYAMWLDYTADRPKPWPKDPPDRQADSANALFVTHRGRRITPRDLQNITSRVSRRLPHEHRRDFTPHALRHTMATLALAEGTADLPTVQRLLGHASLSTTGMYLDEVRENLARAVADNPVTGE